jgi:hypothetical protein
VSGATILGVVGAFLAKVPDPSPSATATELDPYKVSPGLAGFLVTFGIALASIVLYLSLTKQLRRVNRRAAQQEAEDAARVAGSEPSPAAEPDADRLATDDDERPGDGPRPPAPGTPGA